MTPPLYVCSNFPYCDNPVSADGETCRECQNKQKRQQKNRWQWAGWSREEERQEQNHHGKKNK